MKVKAVEIDKIKPYDNNPRDNDDAVDAVAKSIKEFGWQQPIVVDNGGVIIAGHTRYKAAKKLGLKVVPVKFASDLTSEQVKAYRLADNKTAELAEWDFGKMNAELNGIDDIDMTQFGFDDSDMKLADGWDDSGNLEDYEEPEEKENSEPKYVCPKCGYEGAEKDFKQ